MTQYIKEQEVQYEKPVEKSHILTTLILVGLIMGGLSSWDGKAFEWRGLFGNLATELVGAVITYIIIERLIGKQEEDATKRAAEEKRKRLLIKQLENPDNSSVRSAINELEENGWMTDGSLSVWFLKEAKLQKADLRKANLRGLGLYKCDLTGAKIEERQLVHLNDLRFTIMKEGTLYDGRYRLKGDLDWASTKFNIDIYNASDKQMADYYGVSVEAYLEGQAWAEENLEQLRQESP